MKLGMLEQQFFTTTGGEKIAYYIGEDRAKPKLLLIHGNASTAFQYLELVEEFQDDFDLLVPELRGYGDSSYNSPVESLMDFAKDVYELTESLQWKDFSVIGWSLGGGVAVEFAYLAKEKVNRLVLTASMGMSGYPLYHWESGRFDYDRPLKTKEEIAQSIYYLPAHEAIISGNDVMLEQGVRVLFSSITPTDAFVEAMVSAQKKQRNLLDADYALMRFNVSEEDNANGFPGSCHAKALSMPILMLHGEEDHMVSVKLAKKNADIFGDNAELIIFEDAGHVLHLDAKEEWMQAVRAFLN